MEESLIHNPTAFSKYFDVVARRESDRCAALLSGGFFTRIRFHAGVRLFLSSGYRDLYNEFTQYALAPRTDDAKTNLRTCTDAFAALYDKIVYNNVALAVQTRGESFSIELLTVEDEKNRALKNIARDARGACEAFRLHFGHYALNAYEVAERRFREYTCEELGELAAPMKSFPLKDKITAAQYFTEHTGRATPSHLVAIRERGKSCALEIVASIRRELLTIQDTHDLERPVFTYGLDDLLRTLP